MNGPIEPVVILGATGTIGRGVVAAAVAASRPVLAIARDPDALAALRAAHPDASLDCIAGSVASDGDAAALAARVTAHSPAIGGVVVAVRGCIARGRLLDAPADALRHALDDDLLPHFFAARHLLPLLAANPRSAGYVLVGGPAADTPWAGYGRASVSASALRMLARVLHDEARALHVRVQMLSVDAPVRTTANAAHACPEWPDVLAVGRSAMALIDGANRRARAVVHHPQPDPTFALRPTAPAPDLRDAHDARALLHAISHSRLDTRSP